MTQEHMMYIWIFKNLRRLRFNGRIATSMAQLADSFERLAEAGKITTQRLQEMRSSLERAKRIMYAHRIERWQRRHARRRGRTHA